MVPVIQFYISTTLVISVIKQSSVTTLYTAEDILCATIKLSLNLKLLNLLRPFTWKLDELLIWCGYFYPQQLYGPAMSYKLTRMKVGNFKGLPSYRRPLLTRLHSLMRERNPTFRDFIPISLMNIEYHPERGSMILPHVDDRELYGERVVVLSLLSDTCMQFTMEPPIGSEVSAAQNEWQKYSDYRETWLPAEEVRIEQLTWPSFRDREVKKPVVSS